MLLEHPAVKDAGVFGEPDPLREEIVESAIVPPKGWISMGRDSALESIVAAEIGAEPSAS